ncbi:hypothetical protein [Rhizobium laguerreae]|uniref:hypothetical protein n=1 Tax=Rhizobium laguerreae TaxID=1076926 RepID=UPI001C90238B|nr:hypothetical protein [Rhizobium laguerreae]MBY3134141.1 hypothetical protein [Rhizobium laguerreae]
MKFNFFAQVFLEAIPRRLLEQLPVFFIGDFRDFRLEPGGGSCNVYQSVKLSARCKTKATGDFPALDKTNKGAQERTTGTGGHALCMTAANR